MPMASYSPNSAVSYENSNERTELFTGNDLYNLLCDAARDAQSLVNSDPVTISDRMTDFMKARLNSQFPIYDFFLCLSANTGNGSLGWANDGTMFPGMVMWGGGQGVLPGIGSRYGVMCTVVWS